MAKEIIVVVGYGWVGQANALALFCMGYDVSYYDVGEPTLKYQEHFLGTYNKITRLENVLQRDSVDTCYIVCVGDRVSEEGNQDISYIQKALKSISDTKGTIILRSTILPGLLKDLKFDFYIPEFLHEKKAVEECMNPHYFIVGTHKPKVEPSFFLVWRSRAVKYFSGSPEEASYIKYLSNIWNSVRIAFVNEYGNAIATPSTQANLQSVERVINFFFEHKSYLRYGKSFGGHCLPKDTRAFVQYHKKIGRDMSLMEGVYKSNLVHQKVENENNILPEWFSEWVRSEPSGRVALRALFSSIGRNIRKVLPVRR